MPRRASPSQNVLARVRAAYGLRQAQLALYLGVSPALVQHLESSRRALTSAVLQDLLPLAQYLPPAPTPAEAARSMAALPPAAAELEYRRRVCLLQAARCQARAAALAQRAWVADNWAQALPRLLASPVAPASIASDPAAMADRTAWRAGWLQRQARPLPAAAVAQWHLLRARAVALETEAAALGEALSALA